MRDTAKALIVVSALFLAIVVTGCVQNNDNSVDSGTGTGVMPPGSGTAASGQPDPGHMQNNQTITAGPGNQNPRQHGLPNATILAQAAEKLGVSQQQVESVLTGQAGARQNLSVAAQQAKCIAAAVAEALGIPPGNPTQRVNRNITTRPAGS